MRGDEKRSARRLGWAASRSAAVQAQEGQFPADVVFERMRAYASDLERASPPVFVGREEILEELRFAAERVAADNPRGMTRVVQGVPGAGKSSLCDEFMASVQGRILAGRRVLCAKLDPSNLARRATKDGCAIWKPPRRPRVNGWRGAKTCSTI